ncbi:transposase [Streptomyces sp. NBC_01003]|uniref:transposase n=1 Tax=Streptomyces sp. NBC_01003 TaxID=2903714 RepID=UPI003866EC54
MPTDEGRLHLATWLDLASREIVGYSMADHRRASLVMDALKMAAGRGRLQPGCIAHSDRGSEYTSDERRCKISRLGLRQSMGRAGSCFDNAAPSHSSHYSRRRSAPAAGRTGPAPARTSSLSSRPSTTDATNAAIQSGATPPVGDPAVARARTRPRGVSIECPRSRGSFSTPSCAVHRKRVRM